MKLLALALALTLLAACSGASDPDQLTREGVTALNAGKPALVNIKIGGSDFRKDAISI